MNDMTPGKWHAAQGADDPLVRRDSIRREFKVGGGIALAFFVGLLGFAALIPLDAGAFAEGVVAVSGNRQAVEHEQGGIVTSLAIVEGQTVIKGQELIRVSASELLAAERGLAGQVVALLAERARLVAEMTGRASVAAPAEFAALPAEDRAMAAEALHGQVMLFRARREALATQHGVLSQRIRQQAAQGGGMQDQIASNREQKRLIHEELDGLKTLVDRGFVSLNRIRAMERDAARLEGDFGAYRADVAKTGEAIGEVRFQIAGLNKDMMEEVATRLREVQVQLDSLQPRLFAAREQLTRSVVRAPAGGRIVGLKIFTVGGVAMAGDTLMEIVPQDRNLIVMAKASPADADDIKVGMETQVRFPAIQERSLPVLKGRIAKISADSLEDPRSGMRYFSLEVVVPEKETAKITALRPDGGLRAGLPAEVLIPLRKRSALAYIFEPLTQTLWKSGREQ
ncbi:HlyD family type I secretion periplasmic adaptor subunit [Sphingopyxis panaciterrae]